MIKDEGLTARTCRKVLGCEFNNEQLIINIFFWGEEI